MKYECKHPYRPRINSASVSVGLHKENVSGTGAQEEPEVYCLEKDILSHRVLPGDQVGVSISFRPLRAPAVKTVTLTDAMDCNYFSYVGGSGCYTIDDGVEKTITPTQSGNKLSFSIPESVNTGSIVKVAFQLLVAGHTPEGVYYDTAKAAFDEWYIETEPVPLLVGDAITVYKEVDQYKVRPGDRLTYTITVTNTTGKDLSKIAVYDFACSHCFTVMDGAYSINDGTQKTVASIDTWGNTAVFSIIDRIKRNDVVRLEIQETVKADAPAGIYTVSALVEYDGIRSNPTPSVPVEVVVNAQTLITKCVDPMR